MRENIICPKCSRSDKVCAFGVVRLTVKEERNSYYCQNCGASFTKKLEEQPFTSSQAWSKPKSKTARLTCPNPQCPSNIKQSHYKPTFLKHGVYVRNDGTSVPRYKCCACGKVLSLKEDSSYTHFKESCSLYRMWNFEGLSMTKIASRTGKSLGRVRTSIGWMTQHIRQSALQERNRTI